MINENTTKKIMNILAGRFKNGYRISSSIDLDRLRNYYVDEYSEALQYDADNINYIITSIALVFDDRAYSYSQDIITKVKDLLLQIGSPCISIDYFFALHTGELYLDNIFSIEMLRAFIGKHIRDYPIKRNYILLHEDASPSALIKDAFMEREEWSFEALHERLPFLRMDSIKQALNVSEYLWVGTGTYTHIDNLDLPESEGARIAKFVAEMLQSRDYVIANELDLSKIINLNSNYPFSAIRDAVFRTFLSDKYDKSGQVITRKGVKLRVIDILEQYCRSADTASFSELNALETSFDPDGRTHSACLTAGYNTMVRVSDELFVSDNHVTFDVNGIDESIAVYCRGDFLPLRKVIDFSLFPYAGYPWNLYLLESYVRRFSNVFKFDVRAVNSSNIGVIVRKDFIYSHYDDILSIALASSYVDLSNKKAIGNYLFDNGYIGWRNLGKSESKISVKAEQIRESGQYNGVMHDDGATETDTTPTSNITKQRRVSGNETFNRPVIDYIDEKCIIIKIKQGSIDRNNGDIYETTRKHWKISIDRAKNADYVLSVQNKVVIEVYADMEWEIYDDGYGRIMFEGNLANDSIRSKYIGKMIPPEHRKMGMASPCLYVNC